MCGASVLGYITTQLEGALSVEFGPAGFIVSGVTITVTCRGAPARSVDRSCLPCLVLQDVAQVGRIFPCLSMLDAVPGHGLSGGPRGDDNYTPPSEDEASLDDDEYIVPEDLAEQEHFKRRLIAMAYRLKKKQQQLQADQDLVADRWTEVLAAEEYELERPSKSYPKRRPLPRSEEEAPTSPVHDMADRPPRGRDREASQPSTQAMPRRRTTKARENAPDL